MEITSLYFILLSILSIFVFYLLKQDFRNYFLTFLSLVFIATYSYYLLIYVILYSFVNYWLGIKIHSSRFRKSIFITGIVLNVFQLVLLKYVSFTINPLLRFLSINFDLSYISKIIIPVGISFFTLQGIGYLINIKLGWEKPEKNFIYFLLYIIFFPRFLSGPIDRSNHFLPQLKLNQSFDEERVISGLRLVLFGVFKKVAIANQLEPLVTGAYANLNTSMDYSLLIIVLLQPLYLYFDFSGYTDIAFGIARSYGIELRPNFKLPFMSESITEFWKRFHVSLSSWFHDYVFIRVTYKYRRWGNNASIFALFLTWTLFGIWHGAGWNFMLLGVLQAAAIYYEYITKKWRVRIFSKLPGIIRIWMGRLLTYIFYGISLVFFFASDIKSVITFFSKLPFSNRFIVPDGIRKEIFILVSFFILILMILELFKNDYINIYSKFEKLWFNKRISGRIIRWGFYCLLISIILIFNKGAVQQFIYFQF